MNLYELTQQQLELKQHLMGMNLDEQTITDTIEGSSLEISKKIENYGIVLRDRESFVDAISKEIERLTERMNAEKKRIERTKNWLLSSMVTLEIKQIECPLFTIAVQDNPPSVDVYNDKLIPAEYMRVPEPKPPVPAPDKRLILADLKAGKEVAGCVLKRDKRIVIK
jgi:hypothetical protein